MKEKAAQSNICCLFVTNIILIYIMSYDLDITGTILMTDWEG